MNANEIDIDALLSGAAAPHVETVVSVQPPSRSSRPEEVSNPAFFGGILAVVFLLILVRRLIVGSVPARAGEYIPSSSSITPLMINDAGSNVFVTDGHHTVYVDKAQLQNLLGTNKP